MHTYSNLKQKVKVVPGAQKAADAVPLIFVVAGREAEENFLEIVKSGSLSADTKRRHSSTKEAERCLGLPPCVYLFAGRPYPAHGLSAVLLFGIGEQTTGKVADVDHAVEGGVTPFDSGGLTHGKLLLDWRKFTASGDMKDYFKDHRLLDLRQWRTYFALFLTECFKSPVDYWENGPCKEIDGKALDGKADDFRNWVFEVQCTGEVPLDLAERGYAMKTLYDRLTDLAKTDEGSHIAAMLKRFEESDGPMESAEAVARSACMDC